MFSKVYETFYETVHENALDDDFCEFGEWYRENGADFSESEQLMYILGNSKIKDATKRALMTRLANKSTALEEEEDILLRIGVKPEEFQERIESGAEDNRLDNRENYLVSLVSGIVLMVPSLIAMFFLSTKNTGIGATTGFCLAVFHLLKSYEFKEKIDEAEEEARNTYESSLGHNLQERIAKIREEREEFYKLDKIIAKNGINTSE